MIKKIFIQQPVFKKIIDRSSETIVVFIHGIFSNSKDGFKTKKNIYWWDIIKNNYPFDKFDFAYFSYNKINLLNLLHKKTIFYDSGKLSNILNQYINQYLNVILIGHSQGGLIAKRYAVDYTHKQNIFLMTMHTPHFEKLKFFVMRSGVKDKWDLEYCYYIQHLFAASSRDQIVQIDNALDGNHRISYISYEDCISDGHSHLNTNPDKKLLEILIEQIHYFLYSGIKININNLDYFTNNNSDNSIRIIFSYSKFKVKKYLLTNKINSIDGWQFVKKITNKKPKIIHISSFNINFFINLINKIQIFNLDMNNEAGLKDEIIPYSFSLEKTNKDKNMYEHIPFDKSMIKEEYLIELTDFYYILNNNLLKNNIYLKEYMFKSTYEEADAIFSKTYVQSLNEYKTIFIEDCMNCLENMQIDKFTKSLILFINELHIKRYTYNELCLIIMKKFEVANITLTTYNIECIFSKLFKIINFHYYLDKNIKKLFQFFYNDDYLYSTPSITKKSYFTGNCIVNYSARKKRKNKLKKNSL